LVGASIAGRFDVAWGDHFNVDFGQSISIILAALGAILTAIAILIGVLAIIGWATFSSQVDTSIKRYIADDFDKEGPLFQRVSADLLPKLGSDLLPKLERSMYQGTQPAAGELPADQAADELLLDEENPEQ
jgi:hypothetical protein